MTRDEAIQFLDNMKHAEAGRAIGKEGFYAELLGYHIQALNMAIKALEQQTCEDCISREAVLENIKGLKKSPWFNDDIPGVRIVRKEAVEIIEDLCIKNLPSVNHAEKQELCEDAVSRQVAIDALKQAYWDKDMQNAKDDPCIVDAMTDWAIRTIKDLPSVNPQPKMGWIPVSEGLPKEDNEVLITIKSCGNWYVCHSVYRDGQFWQKNFEYYSYRKPIAWMPLPAPYELQESEE